jgi:hypothetical protein
VVSAKWNRYRSAECLRTRCPGRITDSKGRDGEIVLLFVLIEGKEKDGVAVHALSSLGTMILFGRFCDLMLSRMLC